MSCAYLCVFSQSCSCHSNLLMGRILGTNCDFSVILTLIVFFCFVVLGRRLNLSRRFIFGLFNNFLRWWSLWRFLLLLFDLCHDYRLFLFYRLWLFLNDWFRLLLNYWFRFLLHCRLWLILFNWLRLIINLRLSFLFFNWLFFLNDLNRTIIDIFNLILLLNYF